MSRRTVEINTTRWSISYSAGISNRRATAPTRRARGLLFGSIPAHWRCRQECARADLAAEVPGPYPLMPAVIVGVFRV